MNVKQIVAVGVMAVALVGASASAAFAASPPSSSSAASTCLPAGHDDAWPAYAQGVPGRDPGVRLWHDSAGWHIRVTHSSVHDRVFIGEIVTTGTLIDVKPVRLEKNDYVRLGTNSHTLAFRFNNYGGTDGVDFATHCAPFLEFGFAADGHELSVTHISIGATAHNPYFDPFVIRRTAA